jgi:uncharacterized protein YbjT (DUF2867 family)
MTAPGPVLVTGGTGQTGRVVTELASRAGAPVVVASRTAPTALPDGARHVAFDWADPGTYRAALDGVHGIYLLPPPLDADPTDVVDRFLDIAVEAGVQRAVLLNSAAFPESAKGLHRVRGTVERMPEWSVLLASGFMQNFTGSHPTAVGIRRLGEIAAAAGDGRMAWIDAVDVGAAAAALLTRHQHVNGEHVLTGPEGLAYVDIAATIQAVSGRSVRYRSISVDERAAALSAAGLPPAFVEVLVGSDVLTANGAEERTTDEVATLAGRPPRAFAEFARLHRAEWS